MTGSVVAVMEAEAAMGVTVAAGVSVVSVVAAVAAGRVERGWGVAVAAKGIAVAVGSGSPPWQAAREKNSPNATNKNKNLRIANLSPLLIPQGVNGMQPRRPEGGVDAEQQSNRR
jgi:hypothetical protein